jgi:hypothetical protein
MLEIFRRGAAKELCDEVGRNIADAAAEDDARISQEPASGFFIFNGVG